METNKPVEIKLLNKGYLFNFVLFTILFLPNPNIIAIGGGNLYTNLRELGCVFLPVIYFLYPNRGIYLFNKKVRGLMIFFFATIIISELLKVAGYGSSISSVIRSLRPCICLFSVLFIILQGVKIDVINLKKTLLWGILISFLLTLLLQMVLGISLEGRGGDAELTAEKTITRFGNQNASFGLIGIVFLMNTNLIKEYFSNCKILAYVTFFLSVIILLISFNRTMLAGLVIIILYYVLKNISFKRLMSGCLIASVIFGCGYYLYTNNSGVKRQIDQRILVLFENGSSKGNLNVAGFRKNAIENTREFLYEQYATLYPQYPYVGVPIEVGLAPDRKDKNVMQNVTDISIVTIVLRYGTLTGLIFIFIFIGVFRALNYPANNLMLSKPLAVSLFVAILCSFNIDLLARQSFIVLFFLLLICLSFDISKIDRSHYIKLEK